MKPPLQLRILLDRGSGVSLVDQIRDAVRHAIESGELPQGGRLPATRQLALSLDVNRQTIVDAYRRLESEGLLEQRPGAGAFACLPAPTGAGRPRVVRRPEDRASEALASYERRAARLRSMAVPLPGALDLAGLTPHERDYPAREFEASVKRVLARRGGAVLGYGPPAGDAELREVLAARLTAQGLGIDASGIVIVGGAQQGLDLLFRALLDPGDTVLTEAPTYHLCLDLLAFHRARVAPVTVTPRGDDGEATLDADALARVLERDRPALAYVMPTFQNPTGLTLDLASRRLLATSLQAAGVTLIEDDYEADMRHGGEALPPVASLPEAGDVVYLGTLSKALFPGLRIGWLAGSPDVLARVAQVKRVSDLSGPLILQAVAADMLASGAHDRHVASIVEETGARLRALADALRELLPTGCTVTRPRGGHVLWLEAPASSGQDIAERAAAMGVLVTPGEAFATEPLPGAAVRVSIARIESADVPRAAEALALAVRSAMDAAGPRGGDLDSPVAV